MSQVTKERALEIEQLVRENLKYARAIAMKLFVGRDHFGFDREDFISAAVKGLCEAALRFNPELGRRFQVFSYPRIAGSVIDMLRRDGDLPYCENQERERRFGVRLSEEHINQGMSSAGELASFVSSIDACNMEIFSNPSASEVEVSYREALNPEVAVEEKFSAMRIRKLVATLPPAEQKIVDLYYYKNLSFSEIQRAIGDVSKSWTCRVHTRAIDSLRKLVLVEDFR